MQIESPQNYPVFGLNPVQGFVEQPSTHPKLSMNLPQTDPVASALVSIVNRVLEFVFSLIGSLLGGSGTKGSSCPVVHCSARTTQKKETAESPFQPLADLGSSLLDSLATKGGELFERAVGWIGGGIGKVVSKVGGFLSKIF